MSTRLSKPWVELTDLAPDELPAQLGVFQLADGSGATVYIGYGGGLAPFGLRTAIETARDRLGSQVRFVRWELTHGYQSRWEELMMIHASDEGRPPVGNEGGPIPSGRLDPGPEPASES